MPLGKAQKRTYVTPAPGAALRLPRVVDATCRRQTQNTVPLRTILPLIYYFTVLRTCALETIDRYHQVPIHVYTDGSALNGVTSAGCGAFLKFPTGPEIEISKAIGKSSDNYDAEIQGLISAIEEVSLLFGTQKREPMDIVIFTDSMSALKALDSSEFTHLGIESLALSINSLLTSYDIQLTLQ